MKLLFDQNLSHRLCKSLQSDFPELEHVRNVNLHRTTDREIWKFALENDFTIVTKDSDFWEQAILKGPPPKVIWIQLGNCTTQEIHDHFVEHKAKINKFMESTEEALLTI